MEFKSPFLHHHLGLTFFHGRVSKYFKLVADVEFLCDVAAVVRNRAKWAFCVKKAFFVFLLVTNYYWLCRS